MGNVLPFGRSRSGNRGTVHVMLYEGDGFGVSHESASGNSWGEFLTFASAAEAVSAAYALNRDKMGGECDVYVPPAVLALLPTSRRASLIRGEF